MSVSVQCPACKAQARVGQEVIGRTIRCPKCNKPFLARAGDSAGETPTPGVPAGRNMLVLGLIVGGLALVTAVVLIVLRLAGRL